MDDVVGAREESTDLDTTVLLMGSPVLPGNSGNIEEDVFYWMIGEVARAYNLRIKFEVVNGPTDVSIKNPYDIAIEQLRTAVEDLRAETGCKTVVAAGLSAASIPLLSLAGDDQDLYIGLMDPTSQLDQERIPRFIMNQLSKKFNKIARKQGKKKAASMRRIFNAYTSRFVKAGFRPEVARKNLIDDGLDGGLADKAWERFSDAFLSEDPMNHAVRLDQLDGVLAEFNFLGLYDRLGRGSVHREDLVQRLFIQSSTIDPKNLSFVDGVWYNKGHHCITLEDPGQALEFICHVVCAAQQDYRT